MFLTRILYSQINMFILASIKNVCHRIFLESDSSCALLLILEQKGKGRRRQKHRLSATSMFMSSFSLLLHRFLGAVRMFVRAATQVWDFCGCARTGAVSPSHSATGHLDGGSHRGPDQPGCAHTGEDSHTGSWRGCCTEQVGGLQNGLRMLSGLHAQGGNASCTVSLTSVGRQEGQAHGVRHAAGAQTIPWEIITIRRKLNSQ